MFELNGEEYTIKGKKCFNVLNPVECNDFRHLIGKDVTINGKPEKIVSVERFSHAPPWRKLENIGLMVAS